MVVIIWIFILIFLYMLVYVFWKELLVMLIVCIVTIIIILVSKLCSEKRNRYLKIQKDLWFLCREKGITDLKNNEEKKKFEKLKNNFLPKYQNKLKLIYMFTINNDELVETFENIYQQKLKEEENRKLIINELKEKKEKESQERQLKLKLEQEKREKKKYLNLARNIYKKCKSIDNLDDEAFRVISYTYGINDINLVKKMYKDALKEEKDNLQKKKERELKKKRDKQFNEEKNILKESLNISKRKLKNRYKNYKDLSNSLIDEVSSDKINDYLTVDFVGYSITSTGRVNVSLKCLLIHNITILNKSGILDGSFKVDIKNLNDEVVAQGYFNGYVDESNVGFSSKKYSILCEVINSYRINKNEQYNVSIVPMYFWILEK